MIKEISTHEMYGQLGLRRAPFVIDVRPMEDFEREPRLIPGAVHLDPSDVLKWLHKIPSHQGIALYSTSGREAASIVKALTQRGLRVAAIYGGIEQWLADELPTIRARPEFGVPGGSRWVTRERPKIDRIACPWLIARFIDEKPEFLYVPADQVLKVAAETGAVPYDIPGVEMTHDGERCSFDAFIRKHELKDAALDQLAMIVRGADTSRLDLTPQSAGLYAISLGLSQLYADDHEMLKHGLVMYDALYAWCRSCQGETHTWPPQVTA